ncbi:guanine nucleotide-binding protein subunit alpha [Chytriomyces hyalinus]|nr:guanine nucleotide-binding protein subunit alpha [Chytriomyces hyalinus]
MGSCNSTPETAAALKSSREIDKLIKVEEKATGAVVKLLLLGAGETGKSTILKQMRLIYSTGFGQEETELYRRAILGNIITSAKCLVFAMDTLKIPYGFDDSKATSCSAINCSGSGQGNTSGSQLPAGSINEADSSQQDVPPTTSSDRTSIFTSKRGSIISVLKVNSKSKRGSMFDSRPSIVEGLRMGISNDPRAKAAELEYRETGGGRQFGAVMAAAAVIKKLPFNIVPEEGIPPLAVEAIRILWADSGVHFMSDLDRFTQPKYIPGTQDILNCRIMTTSVTETNIIAKDTPMRIFDVGGQRSERKKWAPYFDDVSAIIYLAAISSYDQLCYEDNATNRILEALNLFGSICNHPMFKKTSMILFLNKIDLFKQKLGSSPIAAFFPTYTGPNEYEHGSEYFANRFLTLNKYPERKVYVHFTWATDTNQTRKVLETVNRIIRKKNLSNAGI